jgi:hypothetical protein
MHAASLVFLAAVGIPDARHCFALIAPFVAVAAAVFLLRRMDVIMDHLFPHWEWERKLGWLNIRAQQRADSVLRWLGYFVYAALGLALLGIVWSAKGLAGIENWADPRELSGLLFLLPVLLVCVGFWLVYLGFELIPKLRGKYEEEELEKYRAEQAELEREYDRKLGGRMKSPQIGSKQGAFGGRSRLRR